MAVVPDDPMERRAARRAWIVEHHPDRGGDPELFAAGLARFEVAAGHPSDLCRPRPPITVTRSRSPVRTIRRLLRQLAGRPPRRLL